MLRAILFLLLSVGIVSAQEIVTGLSSHQAQVGQPVQFIVTVRGARGAEVPDSIPVNGLRIQLAGRSTQFEMRNMKMSSSLTYTYMVVPQFEGEFVIPAFDIRIGNQNFRTQPMRLSVGGGVQVPSAPTLPQHTPPLPRRSSVPENSRAYFGELLLSKKTAYAGEIIPAELRFYFNGNLGGQVGDRPSFGGEGFTVQKFTNAIKREQRIEDENYVVFSFQTAITAVKAGTLEIPASKLEARLEMPGGGMQGLPDIFKNFQGMIPPGMLSETTDVSIETAPVTIEILALPKDGRPEDFSGAIGKFELQAAVTPKKAAAGDPVTLRATITGQGNFEAMGAPALTNDEGWRSYPPADKFEPSDGIHFGGEKIFEFPLIARQDQTKTPGLRFSYFNPLDAKYVTLIQDPLPVEAKAGAAAPPPTVASGSPAPAQATPQPAATPDVASMPGGASSWTSLLFRKEFLAANAGIACVWLITLLVLAANRFAKSPAGHVWTRKREAKKILGRATRADGGSFDVLSVQFLCLRLGVKEGDTLAAAARIDSSPLPRDLKSALHRVLERHGESKYAAGAGAPPDAAARADALAALNQLNASHEI